MRDTDYTIYMKDRRLILWMGSNEIMLFQQHGDEAVEK